MFHLIEDRLSLPKLERVKKSNSLIELRVEFGLARILKLNLSEGCGRCDWLGAPGGGDDAQNSRLFTQGISNIPGKPACRCFRRSLECLFEGRLELLVPSRNYRRRETLLCGPARREFRSVPYNG